MNSELLSTEDNTKILQNRFNRTDIKFISSELKPISENVEGFLGEHFNLNITYELDNKTDTEVFFIKTKSTSSDLQIGLCNEINAYKKEIFIYEILIKEFNKYGYDTSFVGKTYYSIPEKSLILENLVHKGFTLSERLTTFDLNKIKCVLKTLALYHAAGFAYQETKYKELGSSVFDGYAEFMEEIAFDFTANPERYLMRWWNSCIKTLKIIIDLLPESETFKSDFKNMFNNFPFGKVFVEKSKFAKTCGHGDLWSNNMLFKYENDVPVECRLVDFQLCRYFYPCLDVLLVIFANTSTELRKAHLDELYQYYYKSLADILNNYGCSITKILPIEDFNESIRLTKADALLQVTCCIFSLYLPKEMLTDLVKENDGEGLKKLFFDNTAVACEAFANDDRYRKIVSEALQDMREALLALQ